MKLLYLCQRKIIHDFPLWVEYSKLYPEDEVCVMSVNKDVAGLEDQYTTHQQCKTINEVSSWLLSDEELERFIYAADCIFIKSAKEDNRIMPLINSRGGGIRVFRISETLNKIPSTTFKNRLSYIKKYINIAIHKDFIKDYDINGQTIFLCQSNKLSFELRLMGVSSDRIIRFGYFNYYLYPNEHYLTSQRNGIVNITRRTWFKNNNLLLPFYNFMSRYKTTEMNIYGNIDERDVGIFQHNDNGQKIKLKGFVPNDTVKKELSHADIYFFPSTYGEGFGVALLEAMAAGCIVFANKKAGATKFVVEHNVNGFAFSNRRELHQCIKRYVEMNDKEKQRMRNNAIATIKNDWDPVSAAKKLNAFLKENRIASKGPFSKY